MFFNLLLLLFFSLSHCPSCSSMYSYDTLTLLTSITNGTLQATDKKNTYEQPLLTYQTDGPKKGYIPLNTLKNYIEDTLENRIPSDPYTQQNFDRLQKTRLYFAFRVFLHNLDLLTPHTSSRESLLRLHAYAKTDDLSDDYKDPDDRAMCSADEFRKLPIKRTFFLNGIIEKNEVSIKGEQEELAQEHKRIVIDIYNLRTNYIALLKELAQKTQKTLPVVIQEVSESLQENRKQYIQGLCSGNIETAHKAINGISESPIHVQPLVKKMVASLQGSAVTLDPKLRQAILELQKDREQFLAQASSPETSCALL